MDKKRGRTYVAIVLDRSGSMERVKEETVKGYNEQVKVLLEEASIPDRGETFASLVTFNGQVTEDFFNAPIEILREMHPSQYTPSGWTAMYDAVGYTIEKLCKETDTEDDFNSYLIVVISDGEENRSRFWRGAVTNQGIIPPSMMENAFPTQRRGAVQPIDSRKDLAAKVKELQDTNRWTFTYIGANQDLTKITSNLNFRAGNTMEYTATKGGTAAAFTANSRQLKKFLDVRKTQDQNYSVESYFDGAKNTEELLEKQKETK
jgi:hypothetical protein